MQSLSRSNNNKEIVWKRELSEILKKHGLISEKFTGEISINISQGGVSNLKKLNITSRKIR